MWLTGAVREERRVLLPRMVQPTQQVRAAQHVQRPVAGVGPVDGHQAAGHVREELGVIPVPVAARATRPSFKSTGRRGCCSLGKIQPGSWAHSLLVPLPGVAVAQPVADSVLDVALLVLHHELAVEQRRGVLHATRSGARESVVRTAQHGEDETGQRQNMCADPQSGYRPASCVVVVRTCSRVSSALTMRSPKHTALTTSCRAGSLGMPQKYYARAATASPVSGQFGDPSAEPDIYIGRTHRARGSRGGGSTDGGEYVDLLGGEEALDDHIAVLRERPRVLCAERHPLHGCDPQRHGARPYSGRRYSEP